jgi:hypothetical protein
VILLNTSPPVQYCGGAVHVFPQGTSAPHANSHSTSCYTPIATASVTLTYCQFLHHNSCTSFMYNFTAWCSSLWPSSREIFTLTLHPCCYSLLHCPTTHNIMLKYSIPFKDMNFTLWSPKWT